TEYGTRLDISLRNPQRDRRFTGWQRHRTEPVRTGRPDPRDGGAYAGDPDLEIARALERGGADFQRGGARRGAAVEDAPRRLARHPAPRRDAVELALVESG